MISSVTALLCVSMQCSNITQHHCYEDVRTSNEFSFNIQLIISLGLYSVTMILFYIFISNNYVNMVYEEGDNNA